MCYAVNEAGELLHRIELRLHPLRRKRTAARFFRQNLAPVDVQPILLGAVCAFATLGFPAAAAEYFLRWRDARSAFELPLAQVGHFGQ
jgi:hypothetical protein